jgi:hypothetical protein
MGSLARTKDLLEKIDASSNDADATVAVCDAAIAELASSTDADAPSAVARALFEKGRALSKLGRASESQIVVAELVRRFEHDPDQARRTLVCRALFGRAKDRLDADAKARRAVVVEYRHILHIADRAPPIDVMAAAALFHLALAHAKMSIERGEAEHREKATERFAEIARRFGTSQVPEIAHWVKRAAECAALL